MNQWLVAPGFVVYLNGNEIDSFPSQAEALRFITDMAQGD